MFANFAEDKRTITSWFAGPQDPEVWPDVEPISASDPRYVAYYEFLPLGARIGLPVPTVAA